MVCYGLNNLEFYFFFRPEGILVSIASIPQGKASTLAQKKFAAKIYYCPATGLSFRCWGLGQKHLLSRVSQKRISINNQCNSNALYFIFPLTCLSNNLNEKGSSPVLSQYPPAPPFSDHPLGVKGRQEWKWWCFSFCYMIKIKETFERLQSTRKDKKSASVFCSSVMVWRGILSFILQILQMRDVGWLSK